MLVTHMPGIHAGSFLIPGGNGLPDLEVLTSDPAGWVAMQIAARQAPPEQATAAAAAAGTPTAPLDPQGNILSTGAAPATSFSQWATGAGLKDALTGFAVAGGMILLAVLLVVLGAYQFTKD